MKPTYEQLEMLLVRCVGTLEGVLISRKLPVEANDKIAKLLQTVYDNTNLTPVENNVAVQQQRGTIMSNQDFIDKWGQGAAAQLSYSGTRCSDWWNADAYRVFWAMSYQMPRKELIAMSLDLLSIPGIESNYSSSASLAREVTRYRDAQGNVL